MNNKILLPPVMLDVEEAAKADATPEYGGGLRKGRKVPPGIELANLPVKTLVVPVVLANNVSIGR